MSAQVIGGGLILTHGASGRHRITNQITRLGIAGSYLATLHDGLTKAPLMVTWSAANGSYAFDWIAYRPGGYFVIAYDHTAVPKNAAIADRLTPEPMP